MCLLRGTDWVFIYNSTFCPHSVFMCFVWIWEQTAIICLYSIDLPVFKTEPECLLRGTKWVFKSDRYSFVRKGLTGRKFKIILRQNFCPLFYFYSAWNFYVMKPVCASVRPAPTAIICLKFDTQDFYNFFFFDEKLRIPF